MFTGITDIISFNDNLKRKITHCKNLKETSEILFVNFRPQFNKTYDYEFFFFVYKLIMVVST